MKKICILSLVACLAVCVIISAGCVSGDAVVGTWECGDKDSLALIYTFNADGTGTYTTFMYGKENSNQDLTWKKISDGKYTITSSGSKKTATLSNGVLFDGGREYIKV